MRARASTQVHREPSACRENPARSRQLLPRNHQRFRFRHRSAQKSEIRGRPLISTSAQNKSEISLLDLSTPTCREPKHESLHETPYSGLEPRPPPLAFLVLPCRPFLETNVVQYRGGGWAEEGLDLLGLLTHRTARPASVGGRQGAARPSEGGQPLRGSSAIRPRRASHNDRRELLPYFFALENKHTRWLKRRRPVL